RFFLRICLFFTSKMGHKSPMLQIKDLDYSYPEDLIAIEPSRPSRVMWVENEPCEISIQELIQKIPTGDVLVLNDTKVLKRRVFVEDLEILFIHSEDRTNWDVLFPASRM